MYSIDNRIFKNWRRRIRFLVVITWSKEEEKKDLTNGAFADASEKRKAGFERGRFRFRDRMHRCPYLPGRSPASCKHRSRRNLQRHMRLDSLEVSRILQTKCKRLSLDNDTLDIDVKLPYGT